LQTILFWHRLRGTAAALKVPGKDRRFDAIRGWGARLDVLLERVEIPIEPGGLGRPPRGEPPLLSPREMMRARMRSVLEGCRSRFGNASQLESPLVREALALADSAEQFRRWATAVATILVLDPERLPAVVLQSTQRAKLLQRLAVLSEVLSGRRNRDYQVLEELYLRYPDLVIAIEKRPEALQRLLVGQLEELVEGLDASPAGASESNPWRNTCEARLSAACGSLAETLREPGREGEEPLFEPQGLARELQMLQDYATALLALPADAAPVTCWARLMDVFKPVHRVLYESYQLKAGHDGQCQSDEEAIGVHARNLNPSSVIPILYHLRNAGSHTLLKNPRRAVQAWNHVLGWSAKSLERRTPRQLVEGDLPAMAPESYLPLTPLEACDLASQWLLQICHELAGLAGAYRGKERARIFTHRRARTQEAGNDIGADA
jgi:hypothetical protein